jgi:hypothetical protein
LKIACPSELFLRPVIGTVWVVPIPAEIDGFAVSPRAFPVAVPRCLRIGFVLPRAFGVFFGAYRSIVRPLSRPDFDLAVASARRELLP